MVSVPLTSVLSQVVRHAAWNVPLTGLFYRILKRGSLTSARRLDTSVVQASAHSYTRRPAPQLAVLRCSLAEDSLGQASNGRLGAGSGGLPVRELLELAAPELQGSCLRLALPGPATEQQLLKLDEQGVSGGRAFLTFR